MHIAGGGPSALASGLLPDTLTTKRIDKVRYFDPQISNRDGVGVAGRLVEYGDLDFVRLVDDDLKVLLPPVRLAGMRTRALGSFDFECDEGVGNDTGGAPTGCDGRVVELPRRFDRYLEFTGERLRAQVRLGVAVCWI